MTLDRNKVKYGDIILATDGGERIFITWLQTPHPVDDHGGTCDFIYQDKSWNRDHQLRYGNSGGYWTLKPPPRFEVGKKYRPKNTTIRSFHLVVATNDTYALTWVTAPWLSSPPVPGSLPHSARPNWEEV